MTSMTGNMGPAGGNFNANAAGKKMRGLDPSMKHISGHHRFQQFTPEAMNLYQQLFGQLGPDSYLSRLAGGDEDMFNQIEAPAMRQFGELQGQNASRFSGMGMGARRGSGFQNFQGQQTSDFAQNLQAQRMGLQRQALGDLMNFSQMLMGQQPYGLQEKGQKQPSGWGSALGGLGGGLLGGALGGPGGFMGGAKLGSQLFGGL